MAKLSYTSNEKLLEREKLVLSLIKEKNVFPIGYYDDEIGDYLLDYMYERMLNGTCLDQRLSVKDLYEQKYKNRR
jgi:hypothetical protein